jgi:general secretion pathway protein D
MVAEQLQELLGRPILVDPAVSARITLLSGQPITPDAFYGLFKSALEVHGLVALDAGNAIQIVPDPNARVRQTR